jgi:hypothetical protein
LNKISKIKNNEKCALSREHIFQTKYVLVKKSLKLVVAILAVNNFLAENCFFVLLTALFFAAKVTSELAARCKNEYAAEKHYANENC